MFGLAQQDRQDLCDRSYEKLSVCALSVHNARICFAFELVNERRGLIKPFEPLLGRQSMEFSVAVEILRFTLGKCTLEVLGRLDFTLLRFHFGAAISLVP